MSQHGPGDLITTKTGVDAIASRLAGETMIAVDTEFIRETTFYPKVALIQIASRTETWLLDPLALSKEDMEPLFALLKDEKILKIMHASHADQECFHTAYGFVVRPVLDTAIAAALLGMGDNLGLARLMKDILNVHLPKGRARARWLTRPLPQELADYAKLDVDDLVELGSELLTMLEKRERKGWALEESTCDPAGFDVTPEELARKMAKSGQVDPSSYGTLIELFKWREGRAKGANLPRPWIADNETLVALCKSKPRGLEELKHFRGLNGKEAERSGKAILDAIEKGKTYPKDIFPRTGKGRIPTEKENHILDLIGSYVAYLAAKHEIATRFLLSSQKTFQLWINASRSVDEWVAEEILNRHAAGLIGNDLQALLSGRLGLCIRDGAVELLELKG